MQRGQLCNAMTSLVDMSLVKIHDMQIIYAVHNTTHLARKGFNATHLQRMISRVVQGSDHHTADLSRWDLSQIQWINQERGLKDPKSDY